MSCSVRAVPWPAPLPERITAEELAAHARFIAEQLEGDVVWNWAGAAA